MTEIQKSELKEYYKKISGSIISDNRQKKAFLKEIRENIDEFILMKPDATIDQIYIQFGSPEEIANSFIENNKLLITRKIKIKKMLCIGIGIIIFLYLTFIVASLIDVHEEAHGYFIEGFLIVQDLLKGDIFV